MQDESAVTVVDDDYVAPFPDTTALDVPRVAGLVEVPNNREALSVAAENNTGQAMVAQSIAEIRYQMEMARAFPREQYVVQMRVAKACQDPSFAEVATYALPRGKKPGGGTNFVTGPSIKLAEELARHWGNINWGANVISDSDKSRTIRCFAHDLESNARKTIDVTFDKLIQRKVNGQTNWIVPDESQLLELTNRQAAKGIRNVILGQIPDALRRNAISWCKQTMAKEDRKDPNKWRTDLNLWFGNRGITSRDLEDLVGKPLDKIADEVEVAYLRGIANRIKDGDATWEKILAERAEELGIDGPPPENAQELRKRVSERAAAAGTPRKSRS